MRLGSLDAQSVLENVGECEAHGEADTHAGEQVLQGRILASQVRVIDVNQPEDGDTEASDGPVEDCEVDYSLERDARDDSEAAKGRKQEHEDLRPRFNTLWAFTFGAFPH